MMKFMKRSLLFFAATLLIVAFIPAIFAQDTIEINTEVLNVSVTVRNQDGSLVTDLNRDDFELFDNSQRRDIAFFSSQEAPVSYGIVYDLHPTTSTETQSILRSLDSFTSELKDKEDFFVLVFNEYGSLNINFIPTEEQIRRHLSFGERNEPNSLYDAVFLAGEKLKERVNQKKALIIISDGKDHQSQHKFSELERLFKSFDVKIYTIVLDDKDVWEYSDLSDSDIQVGKSLDDSELRKAAIKALSLKSGGSTETPATRNLISFYSALERIALDTRGGYSLGFYPSEGGEHKLEIKLKSASEDKNSLSYRKIISTPVKP